MSESGSLLRVGRGHVPLGPSVRPDRVRAGARAPSSDRPLRAPRRGLSMLEPESHSLLQV